MIKDELVRFTDFYIAYGFLKLEWKPNSIKKKLLYLTRIFNFYLNYNINKIKYSDNNLNLW